MYTQACSPPWSINPPIARWPKAKSDGQALGVYMEPSQCIDTRSPGVNKGQRFWAFQLLFKLPIQAHTPFLSFILFIYFILLIVLLFFV